MQTGLGGWVSLGDIPSHQNRSEHHSGLPESKSKERRLTASESRSGKKAKGKGEALRSRNRP